MGKRIFLAASLAMLGCGRKQDPAPEPPVHNAFVDHIERGQQTMDTAQARVDAENARIRAQNQQAQDAQ